MTKLSVNLNKVALIRNSRDSDFPRLADFAGLCAKAGAHGLTIHPRPDQRHARYSDVYDLAQFVQDHDNLELNIEGNPTGDFLKVVLEAKPHQCTLVPDEPDQLTSDHGWDTEKYQDKLKDIISELSAAGTRSSIFLDPEPALIPSAKETGTNRIELYTESYARAYAGKDFQHVFSLYQTSAQAAQKAGLGVNAGHDLNQANLADFIRIENILEVSIGHALTVEALHDGFENTIKRYLNILAGNRSA